MLRKNKLTVLQSVLFSLVRLDYLQMQPLILKQYNQYLNVMNIIGIINV